MEELYRAWGPILFSRCRRLLGTDAAAVAATQVIFRRIAPELRGPPRAALAAIYRAAEAYVRRDWERPRPTPDEGDDPTGAHPPREALDAALSGWGGEADGHLQACEVCARARAELASDRARFLDRHFEPTLALVERDARPPFVARWVLWFGPLMVSCVMLAMVLGLRQPRSAHVPRFSVAGAEGGVFRADHPLELRVDPGGARAVVLGTVDARGEVRFLQPGSVTLDGPPGVVRVVAVFSRGAIAPATVAQRLHALAERGEAALRSERQPDIPGATAITIVLERQ